MIRGDGAVEDLEVISLPGFKKPIDPILPIARKFEQKLPLIAAVGNVPDMPGRKERLALGIGSEVSSRMGKSLVSQHCQQKDV